MQFTVRDWMIDLVVFVDPECTVSEALSLMRRRYIHSVIAQKTETSPEYGIITSTDISDKIVAQERNPSQTLVKDIMTSPLITVTEDMSLQECSTKMKENRIHHLPVLGRNGELVGMISASDFLVAAEAMGSAPGERIQ
ncbi:MAG: CBS domain-containing protein [Chloroflexi bacterium]|jgi:CBS domain-containing protein|nr:CBS domain-containing protein [Anaerolineaceae bacterium]NMB86773.1 CBS domain-containing protein [Chloroflexota bacterium]